MELRYLIRALGTQFVLGRGIGLDFPFGTINAHIYETYECLQVDFLATGFEFLRLNSCGKTVKAYCFFDVKILGNVLRIDTRVGVSFLSLVSYIKNSIRDYENADDIISAKSEGSQI